MRRLALKDATIEAMSALAVENTGGLLANFDEMAGWFGSFDAYRKGTSKDRAAWLQSYNGGPQNIDRIGRGSMFVPNWSSCFTGGIQNDPLRKLAANMQDDGLFPRFLVGFAKESTEGEDRLPDAAIEARYHACIHHLARMSDRLLENESHLFTFSEEAQKVRARVERTARNVMLLPTTSAVFREHLSKWPGHFPRLALTSHVVAHEHLALDAMPPEISKETAENVARLMIDYFLPNQARFYLEIMQQKGNHEHARWIAGFILVHARTKVSARDIGGAYRELRDDLSGIQEAMMTLTLSGWVEAVDAEKRNGPTKWEVNPLVHTIFARRAAEEKARRNAVRERVGEAIYELGLDGEEDSAAL